MILSLLIQIGEREAFIGALGAINDDLSAYDKWLAIRNAQMTAINEGNVEAFNMLTSIPTIREEDRKVLKNTELYPDVMSALIMSDSIKKSSAMARNYIDRAGYKTYKLSKEDILLAIKYRRYFILKMLLLKLGYTNDNEVLEAASNDPETMSIIEEVRKIINRNLSYHQSQPFIRIPRKTYTPYEYILYPQTTGRINRTPSVMSDEENLIMKEEMDRIISTIPHYNNENYNENYDDSEHDEEGYNSIYNKYNNEFD